MKELNYTEKDLEKANIAFSNAFSTILRQQPALLMFLSHTDLKPVDNELVTIRVNTQSSIMNGVLEYNPLWINSIKNNTVLAYILGMEGLRIALNHVTTRLCNPIESLKISSDLIVSEDKYLLDDTKKEVVDVIDSIPHIIDYEEELKSMFNFNKSEDFYLEKLQSMFSDLFKSLKQNPPLKGQNGEEGEGEEGQGEGGGQGQTGQDTGQDEVGQGEGGGNSIKQDSKDEKSKQKTDKEIIEEYFNSSAENSKTATEKWGENEMFEEAVKETAKRVATDSSTWGNLSANIIEQILLAHTPKFDPRKILRKFRQSVKTNTTFDTRLKMNRRKGFDYPGKRKKSISRVLFAIDSSGSMSDEQVKVGINMLKNFLKHSEISYCFWDGECSDISNLSKNDKSVDLIGRGYTNPQCVIDKINAERHKFDGIVFFTDAQFTWEEPAVWGKRIFCISIDEEPPEWVRHKMTYEQVKQIVDV